MLVYFSFIAGFIFLVFGANWLVDAAASLAKKYRVSNLVIGLTVVALGTSAPELVVNLVASFRGTADVAMGNVLGSNVSNVWLILGVSALIFPLAAGRKTISREIPFALLGALLVGLLANDWLIAAPHGPVLHRLDGMVLTVLFLGFMGYAYAIRGEKEAENEVQSHIRERSPGWLVVMLLAGMLALVVGGRWIVQGAVEIASLFGMSQALISLTVVALGTSLPELATCVAAAMKRNTGIILGNVIGSNVFNVFFVLGISAVVRPLPYNILLNFDVGAGIASVLLLWVLLTLNRSRSLKRWHGILFIGLYAAYITMLVLRG